MAVLHCKLAIVNSECLRLIGQLLKMLLEVLLTVAGRSHKQVRRPGSIDIVHDRGPTMIANNAANKPPLNIGTAAIPLSFLSHEIVNTVACLLQKHRAMFAVLRSLSELSVIVILCRCKLSDKAPSPNNRLTKCRAYYLALRQADGRRACTSRANRFVVGDRSNLKIRYFMSSILTTFFWIAENSRRTFFAFSHFMLSRFRM